MRAKEFIVESSQVDLKHEFRTNDTELHIEARVQGQVVGSVDFVRPEPLENDTVWESENVTVDEKFRHAGIATAMYNLAKKLVEPGYIVPSPNQSVGGKALWKDRQVWEQGVAENFADGKVKGKSRPGRVKRAGASCNGSVTDLRQRAKNASGEKAKMYHWCSNMKSGRNKS